MVHLIWLHDWETGETVCIDPDWIVSMRRLNAEVYDDLDDEPPQEIGARTRIDMTHDMILVRETPEEIRDLAAKRDNP